VLNKYKIPTVIFWGALFCPLIPSSNCELLTFVGDGIDFPLLDSSEITADLVDKWHSAYVTALVGLFEKHKAEVGKGHMQLVVK
jgi:hypothetical protein